MTGGVLPLACVRGDMDLLRPLGLAGIPCAVSPTWDEAVRYSRFARAQVPGRIDAADDELLENLERFATRQASPPVLFIEADGDLLLVSRHRERLARHFRFLLPDANTVETLLDKARFQMLAEELDLPVPRGWAIRSGRSLPRDVSFPLVVKPPNRGPVWEALSGGRKAIEVADRDALIRVVERSRAAGIELVAQELVPGDERRVESYHAWIRGDGSIAAEFTGRKIRTLPPELGHSTALTTTHAGDIVALGRSIVQRIGLRGAVKLDFKRAPGGEPLLLEVNPRFSLWMNVGAAAGVNLPAVAYADLAGTPAPPARSARPGTTWCHPLADRHAARAHGLPTRAWVRWAMGADTVSALDLDDPLPVAAKLARRAAGAVRRRRRPS